MHSLNDFDFSLPQESIALHQAIPRDSARLLLVRSESDMNLADSQFSEAQFSEAHVSNLADYLEAGDALVLNNTKVIPARLHGMRCRQDELGKELYAKIEITLHKRLSLHEWLCYARPGKKLQVGDRVKFEKGGASAECALEAEILAKDERDITLRFIRMQPSFEAALEAFGEMPLPPYIAALRAEEAADRENYQTIFAEKAGAVAAPTASLHFTPMLIQKLTERGVSLHYLTLHVGAGTFLPVSVEDISQHKMHSEWGEITPDVAMALNAVKEKGGRIIAVGTTALRLLESAADERGRLHAFSGETAIFLRPGSHFKFVDMLMTNFHLPKSTLFMLVAAFSGLETMKKAYQYAIDKGFRFFSYGDSSLLWRKK